MATLDLAVWIVSGILAGIYLVTGLIKAKDPVKAHEMGPTLGAQTVERLRWIGLIEIVGALGVILPAALGILPWVSGVAALGLAAIQAFAIPAHIDNEDTRTLPVNLTLLLAALFVAAIRLSVF